MYPIVCPKCKKEIHSFQYLHCDGFGFCENKYKCDCGAIVVDYYDVETDTNTIKLSNDSFDYLYPQYLRLYSIDKENGYENDFETWLKEKQEEALNEVFEDAGKIEDTEEFNRTYNLYDK